MTPEQLVMLKQELNSDPNSYGYAALIADTNNPALADMLNLPRTAITMPRPDVTREELLEAILIDEFIAAANQNVLMGSYFESLLQVPTIRVLNPNGSDTRVMTNIMRVLKNSQPSESRVRALAVRQGSRAEQLFGVNFSIGTMDVIEALRS